MTPLTTVVEDERQHSTETGDSRAFKAIRLLRSIYLQSSYLGLQQMVRFSLLLYNAMHGICSYFGQLTFL